MEDRTQKKSVLSFYMALRAELCGGKGCGHGEGAQAGISLWKLSGEEIGNHRSRQSRPAKKLRRLFYLWRRTRAPNS